MQLFFVKPEDVTEEFITVMGQDVSHISNVLRMKQGEEATISDGNTFYLSKIVSISKGAVMFEIITRIRIETEFGSKIYLFQCLPKQDKMDMVVMKAVELGAHKIIPVISQRCIARPDEKKSKKKQQRWQAISESAAKQSKRGYIPEVMPIIEYRKAVEMASELDFILFPYEEASNTKESRQVFESIKNGESIGIFIGPEGGFEESEVQACKDIGGRVITLGKRILRTETAGMCVLSILGYLLESQV